jgi:hypothetical protein
MLEAASSEFDGSRNMPVARYFKLGFDMEGLNSEFLP